MRVPGERILIQCHETLKFLLVTEISTCGKRARSSLTAWEIPSASSLSLPAVGFGDWVLILVVRVEEYSAIEGIQGLRRSGFRVQNFGMWKG